MIKPPKAIRMSVLSTKLVMSSNTGQTWKEKSQLLPYDFFFSLRIVIDHQIITWNCAVRCLECPLGWGHQSLQQGHPMMLGITLMLLSPDLTSVALDVLMAQSKRKGRKTLPTRNTKSKYTGTSNGYRERSLKVGVVSHCNTVTL